MGQVLCVVNHKGGSAKTSTAVNLASAFAITRRKILLVDFDPQSNATISLGMEKAGDDSLVGHLIAGNDPSDLIKRYELGGFDVIPSTEDLTALVVAIYDLDDKNLRLKYYIDSIKNNYDLIIIDCPPSSSLITANAICASDFVLIPTPCEYFALDSLNASIRQFDNLKEQGFTHASLLGVLRVMYNEDEQLSVEISNVLKNGFNELLLSTIIPYSPRISEAAGLGRPVILYDKSSDGARAYLTLAGELLSKLK